MTSGSIWSARVLGGPASGFELFPGNTSRKLADCLLGGGREGGGGGGRGGGGGGGGEGGFA